MKVSSKIDTIIIGAGITGQAMALAEARNGKKVMVMDRSKKASGSSVRSLGLCFPLGQKAGLFYDIALRSKAIWKSIAKYTGLYLEEKGALLTAELPEGAVVLEEFFSKQKEAGYQIEMLSNEAAVKLNPGLNNKSLKTALYSKTEVVIDPREALSMLPIYLEEKFAVQFSWETCALHIENQNVFTSKGETIQAEKIYLCNGADFETLYPELFLQAGITRCKSQMFRTHKQPGNWRMGPALSTGLSFPHYESFSDCESIYKLKKAQKKKYPQLLKEGVNMALVQMSDGAINIGRSQEFNWAPDPFNKKETDDLMVDYLKSIFKAPVMSISETWHGIFSHSSRGENVLVHPVNDHVIIINALGNAGITLALGLAEKIASGNFRLSNFGFVSGKR